MKQRFGRSLRTSHLVAGGAVCLALSAAAPTASFAAERGAPPLIAAPVGQEPSFRYESRISAARQPAFSPESARDLPQASSDMAPEGRLRLRPMALQQGY